MDSEPDSPTPPKPKTTKKLLLLAGTLVIVGFLLLSAGITIFIYNQDTDSEGYTYSNIYHVNTSAYAFTLYMNEYKISTWGFLGAANVAEMKFVVKTTNPTKELFIGYATTAASEPYRLSFQCELPTYWHWWAEPYYSEIYINTTTIEGVGAPAQLPQTQTFWLTSAHSNTTAEMTYLPLHEQYIWFIMNLDGTKNITADIQIAFKSPILTVLPFILLPLGLILVIGGVYPLIRKKIHKK
jgi:uncharacterized membrane protein